MSAMEIGYINEKDMEKDMRTDTRAFVYEFTTHPPYLDQYYRLREDCYKTGWALSVFSGAEDEHDRQGHILIARQGDTVIGGGRVVFRYNISLAKLPMETDAFRLNEVLPEIDMGVKMIGEVGRVAVLPEYRGQRLSIIGFYLLAKAQQLGCHYLTTVAPGPQALKYRRIARDFGIDINIAEHVAVAAHPYYNHIEMKLLLCNIQGIPDCRFLLQNGYQPA